MTVVLDGAVELALVGMRRVAVVGASNNAFRASNSVIETLRDRGYEPIPVNPNEHEVLGLRCYPDLASVPGRIDVVDVFRRTEHLAGVAREAVAREDVGVVWNQLGLRSAEARAITLAAGRGYVEHACLEATIGRRGLRVAPAERLEAGAVLLDLDDTVLDHDACERSAATGALGQHGLPDDEEAADTYVAVNAAAWREYERGAISGATLRRERWVRTLDALAARGAVVGAVDVEALSRDYLARFAASGTLLPGAGEAVWWLARRSRVAIATNGFVDVQRARLDASGVGVFVHAYAASEEAGAAKPDPAVLRLALDRLGIAPDAAARDVVVVGDKLGTDVAAGVAIGARTVWIAPDDAVPGPGDAVPTSRARTLADLA